MNQLSVAKAFVASTVRAEKARKNMTFGDLSRALAERGVHQSATNLSTKVARGSMSAALFITLMLVLEHPRLDLAVLAERAGGRHRRADPPVQPF